MTRQRVVLPAQSRQDSLKQQRTHELLLELLSYQVASPVRWIETQKSFASQSPIIERYVEVGPSKILANMAVKQIGREKHHESHLVNRQFLASSDNAKDIFYRYDDNEPESSDCEPTPASSPAPEPTPTAAAAAPAPLPAAPITSAPATAVADSPLTATDAVIAITARILRKGFDEVSSSKSIQELSGGKSTLQNEILGDLDVELGNLPDGSEDLPLATLGAALAGSFKGEPGKKLSSWIAKLVSSKMPPSFNRQAIQRYLSARWGLGTQRQNAVITFAITLEPASRLTSADAAQSFFDVVAQRYASFAGFTLSAASGGTSASQATVVDSEALQAVKKDHQKSLLKTHEVITNLVKVPGDGEGDKVIESEDNSVLEKLDHWVSEFGDDMYLGTRPIFDARKIRVYDAWWNWVRVDLIELKQEILKGLLTSSDISDRIHMIINRWTLSCSNILESLSPEHIVVKQLKNQTSSLNESSPAFVYTKPAEAPRTRIDEAGKTIYEEIPRGASGQSLTFAHLIKGGAPGLPKPVIQLKQQDGNQWKSNSIWTDIYIENLILGETTGLFFSEITALITGAGPGSIASGIVQGLLEGGAEVFVTTSRPPPAATTKLFDDLYKKHGSKGSKLTVIPFNQASKQDCESLVNYIYDTKDEARDLDVIIPFAAISETGQLDGIDAKSELAHRLMLTNLLRMLGHVKQQKEKKRFNTRPTSVILPLSPNHGTFGGDGLYSESKLGLETLFNRFYSEGWSDYLTIVGAVIGWTRGTGLMNTNNILAEAVEAEQSITFSSSEMAFSILALIHPGLLAASENEPILADISGNLSEIRDLKAFISKVRQQLSDRTKLQQALNDENRRIDELLTAPKKDAPETILSPQTERVNLKVGYPELPNFNKATTGLGNLQGLVDLNKTVVVVGFSELGPWGSSRTRWEMEYRGEFTTAGIVEITWLMGLIEHVDGQVNGAPYAGWVDAKTKQPIQDGDIGATFGKYVLEHTGYRTIEPELLDGYDPSKKEFLHEVVLDEDLPTFQVSKSTAEAFQLEHGDNVSTSPVAETDEYLVKVKKGTRLLIPKAVAFNRTVAGLLPTGWNPAKYGIPDDIISQVDPITAYVLCCVAEALYSAGIKDTFELFAHMNTSELANCIGVGAGAFVSLRKMYRERYLEHSVQSDIFQETFLNTPGAWVNLLLLSSTGPIKTNSGACATAIEAMDTGCESLLLGKSKMAFVGGADDFREEASYEFGNMKATINTDEEALAGRTPKEMCRPSTTTRGGFMESAGCGIQIITTADMALKMGLPIYGIVAHTQTSSDRIGRSIPAPGQGVLTAAREAPGAADSPLLDIGYRREKLNEAIKEIDAWWQHQLQLVNSLPADNIDTILESLDRLRDSKISNAKNLWGSNFRQQNDLISPLRAALAVWGLTVDDIGVASLHGTSTKANDKNEANVINQQMTKLGRSLNNPILTISQKWLTGHPKGAAGAWMFNGGIQVLQTGIVPGNRNADNIDSVLRPFEHLVYPPRTIYTPGVKAVMLTSFGFGQKGGLVITVSPNHVFAAITEKEYEDYKARTLSRQQSAGLDFIRAIQTNSLLKPKAESPWKKDNESAVLLDPRARAHWDSKLGKYIIEA